MFASMLDPRRAIEVLETTAQEGANLPTWIDDIASALGRLMPSPLGGSAILVERHDDSARVLHVTTGLGLSPAQAEAAVGHLANAESIERFYFGCQHVDTMSAILPSVSEPIRLVAHDFLAALHAADLVGLAARSARGHALVVSSIRPTPVRFTPRERMLLGRVVLHVETGLRMRLDPGTVVAVLRADGTFLHADGEARTSEVRARLAAQVERIERGKTRAQRGTPEAVDAWTALVDGRYGFVERTAARRREYLVLEHDSSMRAARCFTAAQARAVELSASGMSGKLVAYALGVSDGEVSRLLAQAAVKAGFASRNELVGVAAMLRARAGSSGAPRGRHLGLTDSEQQILDELRSGQSNREIAAARGTSVRTIANQVASMLRKTRLPSRRALATLVL